MNDSEENPQDQPRPPEERVAGAKGDLEAGKRVDSLIEAGGLASLLEEGAFPEAGGEETIAPTERLPLDAIPAIEHRSGRQIGPYRLLDEIGAGGFGVVYRAEQEEPVVRTVALKIIKPGMDSREIIARFEAERQTLALMEHPNIATVLDAGTTEDGRLYFVMEMVKGMPITWYCDRNRLTTKQRLQLFLQVCAAIQHAHQKGIIHRDIKPSNILIAQADGQPLVKVIDFGIAKALERDGGEETMFTLQGQIVGTPQYMSPEQADDQNSDIDTRSDIYSLGVLLYELLTGATPIDPKELRKAGFGGMQRLIREGSLRKPSTRITTTISNGDVTTMKTRGEAPSRVVQMLRGDLDWIVMKALEKERDRRYDTARGFAQDIECFLHHEPVSASPPTAFYLMRKFAARHRGLIAASAAIAVSLIVGVVGMTLLYFESESNRQTAVENLEVAEREQRKAEAAKAAEQRERARAEAETDRKRRLLYASDMQLAAQNWDNAEGTAKSIAAILAAHVPGPKEEDLRDFAWRHQWQLLNRESIATAIEEGLVDATSSRDGTLITLNRRMKLRRWRGDRREPWSETDLGLGWQKNDLSGITPDGRSVVHIRTNVVRVMAVDGGAQQLQFPIAGAGRNLRFSSDSTAIGVVNAQTSRMQLLDLRTGKVVVRATRVRFPALPQPVAIAPLAASFAGGNFNGNGVVSLVQSGFGVRSLERAHDWTVQSLAWSAGGLNLASGDGSGVVMLRHRSDLDEPKQLKPHSSKVRRLIFSPDGKLLASAGVEAGLSITEVTTGEVVRRLKGHTGEVLSLRFSPDGRYLASTSADGTARLWDLKSRTGSKRLHIRYVGATVRETAGERDVRFVELANLNTNRLRTVTGAIQAGDRITGVGVGTNAVQSLADLPVEKVLSSLQGEPNQRLSLEVVSAGDPKENTRTVLLQRGPDAPDAKRMAFSPDGRWFAAQVGFHILVWDWLGHRATWQLPDFGSAMAFSPDSRLLAVNDVRGRKVKLWDMEKRELVQWWNWSPVGALAFSRDGEFLAASQGHHLRTGRGSAEPLQTRIFGLTNRRNKMTGLHDGYVSGVAFAPDDRHLATAGQDGRLKIWNTADWGLLAESQPVNERLACLAYSPDGRTAIAGSWDGTLFVWDSQNGELLDTVSGHASIVTGLDFSPDGRTLASSSTDRTVKLWDVRTRQLLRTLSGEQPVIGIAFAKDGSALVSGARLGETRIWPAAQIKDIEDHPLTVNSMNNLANTFLRRGPVERAIELFRQVAGFRQSRLGAEHLLTLQAFTDLGDSMQRGGQWAEAMAVWETNLTAHVTAFGAEDDRTREMLDRLAGLYAGRIASAAESNEFSSAVTLSEHAIDRLVGLPAADEHIARFLLLAGRYSREMGAVAIGLKHLERGLGLPLKDSDLGAGLRHELGLSYLASGSLNEAEMGLREALKLRRESPQAPAGVGRTLADLAQVLMERRTPAADDEAIELCQKARVVRADHRTRERICRQLVELYGRKRDEAAVHLWKGHAEFAAERFEASVPHYSEAVVQLRATLGADHETTRSTCDRLASVARQVGNIAGMQADWKSAARHLDISRRTKRLATLYELKLVVALHQLGQAKDVRRVLGEMIGRNEKIRSLAPREQTAKGILALLPQSDLQDRAIAMARANHESNPNMIWTGIGRGLAEYRAGNFQVAEEILADLNPSPIHLEQRALLEACRALARRQLGHNVEDLITATMELEQEMQGTAERPRGDWHDPVLVKALLNELADGESGLP